MLRIVELIHDRDHSVKTSNVDLWIERRGDAVTRRIYSREAKAFPEPESLDLLIIHGGDQHLWKKEEDPWLYGEIAYVKGLIEGGKPVIGFCLGSQIIAEACGGRVFAHEPEELGFYRIIPGKAGAGHRILDNLERGFVSFEWHSDHYGLPEHMTSLASTPGVPHQIIISSRYPVAGFQFHPEFTLDNIREYGEYARGKAWHLEGEGPLSRDDFLGALEGREETEGLFTRLISNVLAYFAGEFPGSLENCHTSLKGFQTSPR